MTLVVSGTKYVPYACLVKDGILGSESVQLSHYLFHLYIYNLRSYAILYFCQCNQVKLVPVRVCFYVREIIM